MVCSEIFLMLGSIGLVVLIILFLAIYPVVNSLHDTEEAKY